MYPNGTGFGYYLYAVSHVLTLLFWALAGTVLFMAVFYPANLRQLLPVDGGKAKEQLRRAEVLGAVEAALPKLEAAINDRDALDRRVAALGAAGDNFFRAENDLPEKDVEDWRLVRRGAPADVSRPADAVLAQLREARQDLLLGQDFRPFEELAPKAEELATRLGADTKARDDRLKALLAAYARTPEGK